MKNEQEPRPWRMTNSDGSHFYNEGGNTYYAVPILRTHEFGEEWSWLVANVDDFNEKNFTGNTIAECASLDSAKVVVRALNLHDELRATVRRARAIAFPNARWTKAETQRSWASFERDAKDLLTLSEAVTAKGTP